MSLLPMSKTLTSCIANINKALKELPEAPAFNRAETEKIIRSLPGITDAEVSAMVDFRQKKHAETYGDADRQALKLAIAHLINSFGAESVSVLSRNLASELRNSGKVTFTGSQFNAALTGKPEEGEKVVNAEVKKVIDAARKLRQEGKGWSEVQAILNLSDSTRSALYMCAKDRPDFQPKN